MSALFAYVGWSDSVDSNWKEEQLPEVFLHFKWLQRKLQYDIDFTSITVKLQQAIDLLALYD